MSITEKIHDVVRSMAAHRAEVARRHKLEAELAAYSSPWERRELDAIIDRYPLEQTTELRDTLDRLDARVA